MSTAEWDRVTNTMVLFGGFFLFRNQDMDSSPTAKRRRQNKDDDEIEASTLQKLSPVVIFAHGAGAPSSSDWMLRLRFFLFKKKDFLELQFLYINFKIIKWVESCYRFSCESSVSIFCDRWKTMLKEALHAADVVTFDYPCELVFNSFPCVT